MSDLDDVTGCFQCDLYVSEHDPETLAEHQAATDAELDAWEAQVMARANGTDATPRVRHLRSVDGQP